MAAHSCDKIDPALLTDSELGWLLGRKKVSSGYERKLRHDINKKLQTLSKLELPLLVDKGFNVTTNCNNVTAGSNNSSLTCAAVGRGVANQTTMREKARGVGFEPTSLFRHGISNPTPYQARRPPPTRFVFGIIGCTCKNVTFDECSIQARPNVNQ
jgi:hypothetical protein